MPLRLYIAFTSSVSAFSSLTPIILFLILIALQPSLFELPSPQARVQFSVRTPLFFVHRFRAQRAALPALPHSTRFAALRRIAYNCSRFITTPSHQIYPPHYTRYPYPLRPPCPPKRTAVLPHHSRCCLHSDTEFTSRVLTATAQPLLIFDSLPSTQIPHHHL